jgi:hypothetical protein
MLCALMALCLGDRPVPPAPSPRSTNIFVERGSGQDQPPIVPEVRPGKDGRGRDPWVFRLIFEDRTRMVVIALRPDLWYVFNPETCSPFKVWEGKMDFRGKVWDFSQDNSRAAGRVLAYAPTEILTLVDGSLDDWTASGVTWDKAWKFSGDGAALTSPPFDLSVWQRVFVAFDEQSRRGRMRVEVSGDGGRTWMSEHFYSALSVTNDTDWQWNFRQLLTKSSSARLRFVQEKGAFLKTLRNVRVFGDQPCWLDREGRALKVVWRGYEIREETKSVSLLYDLVTERGRTVSVRHRPEVSGNGWSELISLRGMTAGDVVFYSPLGVEDGVSRTVHFPNGEKRDDGTRWPFGMAMDGDVLVRYEVAK